MPFSLSPSSLNLFLDCPRCFYLQLVLKVRRPGGPMSSIPIKMDSIIKKYFNSYRERGKLPPLIASKVDGKLPLEMPKTLYWEKDEVKLKGLPDDFLQLGDGAIVPFDHKTKSKPPESTHPSYQLQLDCYTFLLQENNYKTKNFGYLAYYYPEECELHNGLDINVALVKVATNPKRMPKIIQEAAGVLNGKMPQANKECQYCQWKAVRF